MFDLLVHPAGINLDKMFDQRRNVFPTLPQRWQWDRKHIQTVVEITAKFAAKFRLVAATRRTSTW